MYQQMRRSASGGIGTGGSVGGNAVIGNGSMDRKTFQPPMQDTSLLESPSLLDIESRYK